jgi:DNA-binding XRE family transcriptional regulator/predicted GIY-YIG superfamily endonuclease
MTALYRHFDSDGRLLYVGIALNVFRRTREHESSSWFASIQRIEVEHFSSRKDAEAAERAAIKNEKPVYNESFARSGSCAVPALREFRRSRRMTSDEAAAILGVSGQAWRTWEKGTRRIEAERAVLIEQRLGIDRANIRPDLFRREAA